VKHVAHRAESFFTLEPFFVTGKNARAKSASHAAHDASVAAMGHGPGTASQRRSNEIDLGNRYSSP
jgi:hypothetical protein